MNISHIIDYHETLCSVYTDAAAIGISVAHIAEFYLERWWDEFAADVAIPVVEVLEQ
jgi:hypothetical protein